MRRYGLIFLVAASLASAQGPVQRSYIVSTLPAAATQSGQILWVKDGATSSDCSTGGGIYLVPCKSNGTSYSVVPTNSGGTGTVTSVGMTTPAWLAVSGSPVTTNGTLALTGASGQAANEVIGTDGSGVVSLMALTSSQIPSSIAANTSGTAANVTGIVAMANGGTGAASASAGFNALSPLTTLGDVLYGGSSGAGTRLAGNTTAAKKFLTQTGNGTVSAAPGWNAIVSGDVPPVNLASTANGGVTGALPYASLSGAPSSLPPNGAASGDLSGSYPSPTVSNINGTSVSTNAAGDQVLRTTAAATATWASIGNCLDSSGQHLNYSTSTHAFTCGTTAPTSGTVTSVAMTVPTWLSIAGSPIASSGTLAITGGTAQTANQIVGSNSSGAVGLMALTSAQLPSTIAANTTGTSANVTGTVALANGGTNAVTASAAFNNLSPLTTAGDTLYGGTAGAGTRLAAGTSTQVLHSGATPSWGSVNLATDVSGSLPYASLTGAPALYNQTIQSSGTPVTQRAKLNIASGTNITVTPVDNGSDTTTLTIASTAGNGTVTHATGALTAGQLILGNNSDDIQIGNLSGDVTTSGSAITTVAKVHGVTYGASPATNTVPVITSANTATYEAVPVAAGGTGNTSATAAFNALSPLTTLGDTIYASGASTAARLAGNISATKNFYCQTGTGTVSAAPAWCTIASSDVPNNAANTTGTSANITGVAAIANGGTGQTTASAALTALGGVNSTQAAAAAPVQSVNGSTGAVTVTFPYPGAGVAISTGSAWGTSLSAPTGALVGTSDAQTLTNKSIAGSEINSGSVAIANGGTGQTSASAAFNALSPLSILGDLLYGSGANTAARLAGNITTTNKLLCQSGTGTVSAAPSWCTLTGTDIPAINLGTTGNGGISGSLPYSSVSGTPTIPTAGTGLTNTSGAFSVNYGTSSTTAAAGNDTRIANAVQDPGANGLTARTTANTVAARTLQSSANGGLTWTNGDGVSGNPVPVLAFPTRAYFRAGNCQGVNASTPFSLPSTNAPVAACVTGTNTNLGVLRFSATGQTTQDRFKLPPHWTGAVDLDISYRSVATTGNIVWNIATICVADGATTDPAFNTAQTISTAAQGTTLQLKTASLIGITTTGCAANGEMFWKIGLDASSTATGNIDMLGVGFTVRDAK